jgi:gas vesicle protein
MSREKDRLLGLGIGLIAGGAIGYWLNSEQGKEARQRAAEKANEYGQMAADYARENANRVQEKADDTLESGKKYVEKVASQAKSAYENVVDRV